MSQTNTNGASAAASPDAQATIDAARRAAEQVAEDLAKRVTEFAAEAGEAVRAAISKASASAGKISDQAGLTVLVVGSNAAAAATTAGNVDVIAWAKSKGAYAGITFEGSVIKPRDDWNTAFYGHPVVPAQVLKIS